MANENKKPEINKKPKFSAYWIYAIIIIGFLALHFMNGDSMSDANKITVTEFKSYLKNAEIEKVVIVNRRIAKVYLTDEAAAADKHKDASKGSSFLSQAGSQPHYQFEFGDLQNFENEISQIKNNSSCLLYTSPSPRDRQKSRMPSSA